MRGLRDSEVGLGFRKVGVFRLSARVWNFAIEVKSVKYGRQGVGMLGNLHYGIGVKRIIWVKALSVKLLVRAGIAFVASVGDDAMVWSNN